MTCGELGCPRAWTCEQKELERTVELQEGKPWGQGAGCQLGGCVQPLARLGSPGVAETVLQGPSRRGVQEDHVGSGGEQQAARAAGEGRAFSRPRPWDRTDSSGRAVVQAEGGERREAAGGRAGFLEFALEAGRAASARVY